MQGPNAVGAQCVGIYIGFRSQDHIAYIIEPANIPEIPYIMNHFETNRIICFTKHVSLPIKMYKKK